MTINMEKSCITLNYEMVSDYFPKILGNNRKITYNVRFVIQGTVIINPMP